MRNQVINKGYESKTGSSCTGACLQKKLAGPRGLALTRALLRRDAAGPRRNLLLVLDEACTSRRRDSTLRGNAMQGLNILDGYFNTLMFLTRTLVAKRQRRWGSSTSVGGEQDGRVGLGKT